MANVKPIPEGVHTVTPTLVVKEGKRAIEFYKAAFGAKELGAFYMPDGQKVMHADLLIGDSHVYLGDEFIEMGARSPQSLGGSPVSLLIYTDDCDALFKRAVAAGATAQMPPTDQFWGDRYGRLVDPFGHQWAIATRKENLNPEEMGRRAKEAMAEASRK
jgi:PhnB protein